MDSQLVHETISGWIKSCISKDQIAVAHEAVIKLYDQPYRADGTPLSKSLHHQCYLRAQEIENMSEVFVPSVTAMQAKERFPVCDEQPSENIQH